MQPVWEPEGAPLSPDLYTRLASLQHRLISQEEAQLWASKDLKFLVYDDTDVRVNGYDSDDEGGMLEYALKMSTEYTENISASDEQSLASSSKPQTDSNAQANNGEDGGPCRVCSSLPEFPHNRKIRKFRLVKPLVKFMDGMSEVRHNESSDACAHYLAISHCWPAMTDTAKDQGSFDDAGITYQVRDVDGSVRRSRTLDDILDRAVDVANTVGLRMIWIDKECLPQPTEDSHEDEKYEQQLGVQAMDIVYYRAMATAGLHDVTIRDPLQMAIIRQLMNRKENQQQTRMDPRMLNYVLDFLEDMCRDRFNTRAWIAQEALSAGNRLLIVLRRGGGITYPSSLRIKSPVHANLPNHTLDDALRGMPSEVICIPGDGLRVLVENTKRLIPPTFVHNSKARIHGIEGATIERARALLETAETLYSPLPNAALPIAVHGGHKYGLRRTADAAGALTLLSTRGCRYQEDRVAIVANMCGYDIRLDTRAVAEGGSLREGLLVQALLNGDLSLLVPEAYKYTQLDEPPSVGTHDDQSLWGSWMFPFDTCARYIAHAPLRNHTLPKLLVPPALTEGGVGLASYMWQIDEELDLLPIKYQWEAQWEELKCLKIRMTRLAQESTEDYEARQLLVARRFAKQSVMRQAKEDFFGKDELSPSSTVWDGIERGGVKVTKFISASRIRQVPGMEQIVARIIFAILRYLFNVGATDNRARGLATSIWQSLRVEEVNGGLDLPDEVGDTLFDHPSVLEEPFQTLQLDVSPDDEYSQLWFVDRIMHHGTLWIGQYRRVTSSAKPDQGVDRKNEDDSEGSQQQAASKGKEVSRDSNLGRSNEQSSRAFSKGILSKQLRRMILAEIISTRPTRGDVINAATVTTFAEVAATGIWSEEAEESRVKNLVSTFNVTGPCTVITPFSSEWEMLPRPALRSMSVCWIVEPVESIGSTRPPRSISPARSEISKASQPTNSTEEQGTVEEEKETGWENSALASGEDQVYRVVGKVKGLWQIMDPPKDRVFVI